MGFNLCQTAPHKLHSKILGSSVISNSGSSHSGQVRVGPNGTFLKFDVFKVGIVLGSGVYSTMKNKKDMLINKVKLLLKKIKAPTYLHKFGPKMYKLWQHVFALFFKANCKLSYRRTTQILRQLGFKVATKSTLQRHSSKLFLPFWQKLFSQTISRITNIVSIDGTGLEKSRASEHYIKRIDAKRPFWQRLSFEFSCWRK